MAPLDPLQQLIDEVVNALTDDSLPKSTDMKYKQNFSDLECHAIKK